MDRTSYIVLGICCVLLFAWGPLSKKLSQPQDDSQGEAPQKLVDNSADGITIGGPEQVITNQTESLGASSTNAVDQTSSIDSDDNDDTQELPTVEDSDEVFEPAIFKLETASATYEFSNTFGGLKTVYLNNQERIITCSSTDEINSTNRVVLNYQNDYEILGLENLSSLGADGGFEHREDLTNNSILFWKNLPNGLQLAQEFIVSTNDYHVTAKIQIKNTTADKPVIVKSTRRSIGSIAVNTSSEQDIDLRLLFLNGSQFKKVQSSWFDNKTLGCIPGTPRQQYSQQTSSLQWCALANRFYSIIVEPKPSLHGTPQGVVAVRKKRTFPEDPKLRPHDQIQAAFYYPEKILEAGQSIVREFDIYVGPKSYKTLKEMPLEKAKVADFGWFGFFSKGLLSAMNGLHSMGLSYALSILLITFIIKMLFWPLTHASTKSMKRMSKLQPQMKEIQEKYKDEPQKMQQKLMAFMKENKVNPMGGCIPMLFQMPVFIGFFYMIRTAFELRGESFLWACDLSQSDTVAVLFGFPINPMPILMGVTMLIQARLTPPAAGVDPMQANMMRYMPLMFVAFLYNFSSALTMYWTFQNVLSIVQTRLTKIDESKLVTKTSPTTEPSGPGKRAKKPRKPKNWLEAKEMAMKSSKQKKKKR